MPKQQRKSWKPIGGGASVGSKAEPVETNYKEFEPCLPWYVVLTTYLEFVLLILVGHIRDFLGKIWYPDLYATMVAQHGYAPLFDSFDHFFTRRLYRRIHDCWNRPIASAPGTWIKVIHRHSYDRNETLVDSGRIVDALNLGSYNYLGFAQNRGPVADKVEEYVADHGVSMCSPMIEAGTSKLHRRLEKTIAEFVHQEDAMIFSMGFATNSTTIPALVGKGGLIVSDALNHTSLVYGARASGAKIMVFKHNDPDALEAVLRKAIADGQPRTHRPWTKILIVVEGIYSMEGVFCCLPEIIALKKKYKCYLYLDEAHSIGATGPTGRGCVEHFNCDFKDIDIMMGTFTKSFGSAGGYIAGNRDLINYLRHSSFGSVYANSMSPACVSQALEALRCIMTTDGTTDGQERIAALSRNSRYFRHGMRRVGLATWGDDDSPVIPMMIYNTSRLGEFSRLMLERGVAVVVVGFPATSIMHSRARFCISAGHTLEDLDDALDKISEVGDILQLKFDTKGRETALAEERENRGLGAVVAQFKQSMKRKAKAA